MLAPRPMGMSTLVLAARRAVYAQTREMRDQGDGAAAVSRRGPRAGRRRLAEVSASIGAPRRGDATDQSQLASADIRRRSVCS